MDSKSFLVINIIVTILSIFVSIHAFFTQMSFIVSACVDGAHKRNLTGNRKGLFPLEPAGNVPEALAQYKAAGYFFHLSRMWTSVHAGCPRFRGFSLFVYSGLFDFLFFFFYYFRLAFTYLRVIFKEIFVKGTVAILSFLGQEIEKKGCGV